MKIKFITEEGIELTGQVESLIAKTSHLIFDIMVKDHWQGQLSFPCDIGSEYQYNDIKSYCRLKRPSLINKDFDLLLTSQVKLKN
jgi:hypothetical protein